MGEPNRAPLPVLGDALLGLRQPSDDDIPALVEACNDPLSARFTRLPVPYTVADAEHYLRSSAETWRDHTGALFVITVNGTTAGTCSLRIDVENPAEGEVGYLVAPWARNRGVARAAVALITDWGLGSWGLTRVLANIEDLNTASIAVARSLGYRRVEPGYILDLKGTQRAMHHWERLAETVEGNARR
jgi:RimJ/RimL family protein N-acetyltransferase